MFDIKEVKRISHSLNPLVRVGKNGITESIMEEIKHLLKSKKIIKVKLNKSISDDYDRKALAKEIAEKTESILVNQIGNNIVLLSKGENGNRTRLPKKR